ncbi:MAG: DinB family protein [Bacteroidota bacterium]
MTRSEHLENFRNGFEKLKAALQNYPRNIFDYKPSPEKWSIHEVIIHMADSEVNSYARCRKIIAESGSSIMAYDQDKWAVDLNYTNQDMDVALDLFGNLRIATYELLKMIPEEKWNNHMMHPERGKVTLDEWLTIYSEHVDVHINQMNRNLEEWHKIKKN